MQRQKITSPSSATQEVILNLLTKLIQDEKEKPESNKRKRIEEENKKIAEENKLLKEKNKKLKTKNSCLEKTNLKLKQEEQTLRARRCKPEPSVFFTAKRPKLRIINVPKEASQSEANKISIENALGAPLSDEAAKQQEENFKKQCEEHGYNFIF